MSEELLKIIHDLETRIEGLENRTEDLENRKPTPGRPGPPGDITAALYNVEKAVPGLVKAEMERLKVTTLRGDVGARGDRGESGLTPTREMVESLIALAMAESQLLDETGEYAGPLLKFAIEQELLKVQK